MAAPYLLIPADHRGLSQLLHWSAVVNDSAVLVWLVSLLALPQIASYVLDVFIWRLGALGTP